MILFVALLFLIALYQCKLKILLSWLFVNVLGSWIGVVIVNTIAMGLYCVVEPFSIKKNLKKIEQRDSAEKSGQKELKAREE